VQVPESVQVQASVQVCSADVDCSANTSAVWDAEHARHRPELVAPRLLLAVVHQPQLLLLLEIAVATN
jgi:hypothetical protein